jgi:hypothetical protein
MAIGMIKEFTPTLRHSFLLLFMRMLVVVPAMALLAPRLYAGTWKEVHQLRLPRFYPRF